MMGDVCDRILTQDGRIGFAMVVDERGQVVESKMRGIPLMPNEDVAAFAGVWTSVMGGVARQMQKCLRPHLGLSTYYDRVNIHGFPVGNNAVVMSARKDLSFETVLNLQKTAEA
jgi:hypothetical protein